MSKHRREELIEKEASKCDGSHGENYHGFIIGATWADANPASVLGDEMSKSRKEEIEEAAEEVAERPVDFIAGAEWADANIPDYIVNEAASQIFALKRQVAMLKEALENYRGIAGNDCGKSTTKWSAADAVLAKLEEMK